LVKKILFIGDPMLLFLLQVQPNPEIPICSKYIHCSFFYALAGGFDGKLRRKVPITCLLREIFLSITPGMATGVPRIIFEPRNRKESKGSRKTHIFQLNSNGDIPSRLSLSWEHGVLEGKNSEFVQVRAGYNCDSDGASIQVAGGISGWYLSSWHG
jgi:hypothetical protein